MFASRLAQVIAAFLLMLMPALAAPLTLSGDVVYRERMALPAGAVLHVGVVSLPDGKPVVGAGQTIGTKAQSPLSFLLNVRSSLDRTPGRYGLVAEIRHGDMLVFATPAPVPIDLANPTGLSILVQRVASQPVPPTPEPILPMPDPALIGQAWEATSIGGKPVTGQRKPTVTIEADLRTSGFGGCNRYFTEASIDGAALSFGPAAATRMACAPDAMAEELSFFAALAAVSRYEVSDNSLRLLDAAGIPLIGFVAAKEQ